jgi:hypothetical protein
MFGDWRETLWTLLVTLSIVIIRCTETFWSPCICGHMIYASVAVTIRGKRNWKALTSTVNFGLDERPLSEESVVELPVAAPWAHLVPWTAAACKPLHGQRKAFGCCSASLRPHSAGYFMRSFYKVYEMVASHSVCLIIVTSSPKSSKAFISRAYLKIT